MVIKDQNRVSNAGLLLLFTDGFVLMALSPILVCSSIFGVRGKTSPVASSLGLLSISDLSACKTRLEF